MAWFMWVNAIWIHSYVVDSVIKTTKSRRKKTLIAPTIKVLSGWQGENKPTNKFSSHFSYLLSLVQEKLHTHVSCVKKG